MAATPTSLTLERRLRRQLDRILDAQTRELVRAWAIAWDEIAPELRDTLEELLAGEEGAAAPRSLFAKSARLSAALAVIADTLKEIAPAAGVRINQDLEQVVQDAALAQSWIVAAQLPGDQHLVDVHKRWTHRDLDALTAIVHRSAEQITSLSKPLAPEAYQAVRRELVRGVALGANPRATAARMVRRAEVEFNGGLTRALNISRTETLDAHRAAAAAGQDRHADVLQGWIWLAQLSPRTCRACLAMHGREFPLEVPGPIGHQQCRCARSPKVKPWSDLGFDVDEPPSAIADPDAYFDRLSPVEQRSILGRKGYDAWVAGDFPREDWARRQENDGWRDSVVAASPGDTGAGSGGDGPPGAPPTGPLDDNSDGRLPIGPVLGTAEQQTYFQWPHNPMPHDHQLDPDAPCADNAFTFIPDPDARATGMLQYHQGVANLAKDLAAYMSDGQPPDEDWQLRSTLVYFNQLVSDPLYGIEADGSNYTADDFVKDLTFAADWLLDQEKIKTPSPVYRGVRIRGDFDIADMADREALLAKLYDPLAFHSATQVEDFARHYATMYRADTSIVLEIFEAVGIRLDSVGRMSSWPEYLLEGTIERVGSWIKNDVLYLTAIWLP